MVSKTVNERIKEIETKKSEFCERQVVIQSVGEIIKEKDGFIDGFLLSKTLSGEYVGILWIIEDINYIPSKTLGILSENGMRIRMENYDKSRQIVFY